ncbi:cyclic nucleotide-binding protein [Treponema medium]|nr:cyclic nucleotide-binding protein [Treponema medium]
MRLIFLYPRGKIDTIRPELPRMAVVPYSSDVLCTHKTRLQLLYTDVQQLKMVQMVSQSQFFRDLYLLGLIRLLLFSKKNSAKFYSKFCTS